VDVLEVAMPALTRRTVLRAAAAAAVLLAGAGCTDADRSGATPTTTPGPASEPDDLLKAAVAAAEDEMIAAYEATLAAHPALTGRLRGNLERHRLHRAVLGTSAAGSPTPSQSAAARPSTPAPLGAAPTSSAPTTAAPPADPVLALEALARQEGLAADARRADCLAAQDGELARLLASVAACEHLHRIGLARP